MFPKLMVQPVCKKNLLIIYIYQVTMALGYSTRRFESQSWQADDFFAC